MAILVIVRHMPHILADYIDAIQSGKLKSLEPLLGLFSHEGKPLTLQRHFQLAPMYDLEMPPHSVYQCGRQVGKSFGIAEKGILLSGLLPDFHTLYVQPRFDQIKRFNTTIMRPLLRSMVIKDQLIEKKQVDSFLMRNFKSNSMMYMEFCLLSPDRTRGISGVSHTWYDESVLADTQLLTTSGAKAICEIKAADNLISYNTDGKVTISTAERDASPHGRRLCFRVTTTEGHVLECTADHRLPTTDGTKRLSEVIAHEFERCYGTVHARPDADDSGNSTRGRLYNGKQEWPAEIPEQSRLVPERLQLLETPDIVRVRNERTVESEERRLRGLVELMANHDWGGVDLLASPAISRWHKDSHRRMARYGRRTRPGLVCGRRRVTTGRQVHAAERPRLFVRRRGVNRRLAGTQVGRTLQHRGRKAQPGARPGRVPVDPGYRARHLQADKRNAGVHTGADGLQGGVASEAVPGVRYRASRAQCRHSSVSRMFRWTTEPAKSRLLRREQSHYPTNEHRVEAAEPGQSPSTEQAQLLGRHRPQPSTVACKRRKVQSLTPRACKGDQKELPGTTQGRSSAQGYGAAPPENPLRQEAERPEALGSHPGASTRDPQAAGGPGKRNSAATQVASKQSGQSEEAAGTSRETPKAEADRQPGAQGTTEQSTAQQIPQHVADRKEDAYGRYVCNTQEAPGHRSGVREESTDTAQGATHGSRERTRPDGLMHDLRMRSLLQGLESVQVLGMQEGEAAQVRSSEAQLCPVGIKSIECIGYHDVYDIEVVGTHSYMLANGLASSNCQDLDLDNIEIIGEVMSATINYGFSQYTGTPKTTDGSLGVLFDRSSQGHLVMPCSCGHHNLAHPDAELFKMIGKWDDNLKTGIHCAKCDKGLDCRDGYFKHLFPDRRPFFPGYHVGQITHPLHCALETKWKSLLYKYNNYTKSKFYNEIAGVSCDESVKLVTFQDLRKACNDIKPTVEDALRIRKHYDMVVMGVDWSGGGALGKSFTAGAILGSRPGSERLDCLHAFRLPMGMKPEDECALLKYYMQEFKCSLMAHDYTGAGYLREVILNQSGIPSNQLVPFTYAFVPKKDIISVHAPSDGARASYILDKARSLAVMCGLVRSRMITLPIMREKDDHPVVTDLLGLVEDPKELPRGGIAYMIQRAPDKSDDFAHALNMASSAIWKIRGGYPEVAGVGRYELSAQMLKEIDPFMAAMMR